MSRQTDGLIFLLIGAGFFLEWGYSGARANLVFDIIFGFIFSAIGFSLIRYHPIADATKSIADTVNRFIDDSAKQLSYAQNARESAEEIEAEVQAGMRDIREAGRMRIQNIAKDVSEMTHGAVK